MIEAGLCYFSGRGVEKNKEKAVELWSEAAARGSREAEIRLTATNVIGDLHFRNYRRRFPTLTPQHIKGRSWHKLRWRIVMKREPALARANRKLCGCTAKAPTGEVKLRIMH